MAGRTLSRPYGSRELEKKCTDQQKRFIEYYLATMDAKKAAIEAGYSKATADQQGKRLLKKTHIARIIGMRQTQLVNKLELSREEVLTQLYYVVTRNAGDFADDEGKLITDVSKLNERAKACVDGIKQTSRILYGPDGEILGEEIKTELKISPKIPAIDMAMKHEGLFPKESQETAAKMVDWDSLHGEPEDVDKLNYIDEALEK